MATGRSDEFALIAVQGALRRWAFQFRVLSEALPFANQRPGEACTSDDRLDRAAVVGKAYRRRITKLIKGNHMTSGPRLARLRFSVDYRSESQGLHVLRLFRPVRRPRPASTRIAFAGETLNPNWNARRALGELRSFAQSEWIEKWGENEDAFPTKGCGPSDSRCGELMLPVPSLGPMALIGLPVVFVPGA